MELLLGVVVLAGATGWYFARRGVPVQAAAGASGATPYMVRNQGPVIGTVPPGITLPGQSFEGPGPNTSGAIVGQGSSGGLGMVGSISSGSVLGAFTAGIGAVVGIGLSLWAAHAARVKGAKDENTVLNELVPNFSKVLVAEFNALNSGQVSPTTALQDLEGIRVTYWNAIAPYQKGPGQHTHPCTPPAPGKCDRGDASGYGGTKCDNSCTAGCCIGCDNVEPTICAAKAVIQAGGGTLKVPAIGASKYGYAGQPAYSLTYVPVG